MDNTPKPVEGMPGPGIPQEGFPGKRGGYRDRGGQMRGPPRGRGFMGRGGPPMRGVPMVVHSGMPGRGALRLVAPGNFMPHGRGGPPGRGRGDFGPMRGDGRGGMFRGRGVRGGPGGRGIPGGPPRGFGSPPRPGGPPRGPPGGPPRVTMARPPRPAAPPQAPQQAPPMVGPPERYPPPVAAGPPPKRGPPPAVGPLQGPGPIGPGKRPRYESPGYANGYSSQPSTYTNTNFANPAQPDVYASQGASFSGNAPFASGGQYGPTYNYPQTGGTASSYQPGAGAYPASYPTQVGYDPATADYSHSTEAYNYGGTTTYTAPQGAYDDRSYTGGGAYDTTTAYGTNTTTYAAKPEYGKRSWKKAFKEDSPGMRGNTYDDASRRNVGERSGKTISSEHVE